MSVYTDAFHTVRIYKEAYPVAFSTSVNEQAEQVLKDFLICLDEFLTARENGSARRGNYHVKDSVTEVRNWIHRFLYKVHEVEWPDKDNRPGRTWCKENMGKEDDKWSLIWLTTRQKEYRFIFVFKDVDDAMRFKLGAC